MKLPIWWGLVLVLASIVSFQGTCESELAIAADSLAESSEPASDWYDLEESRTDDYSEVLAVEPLRLSPSLPREWGAREVHWVSQGEGAAPVPSAASPAQTVSPRLGISVTGGWASKFLFKGFKVLDSGVFMHDVSLDLWQTGFQFKFQGVYPSHNRSKSLIAGNVPPPLEEVIDRLGISFDRRDIDSFVYNLSWKGEICDGVGVELGGNYYDMFPLDSDKADFWENYGVITLSKLPLTPHFGAYYATPYNDDKSGEGWMTNIGVSHMCPVPALRLIGTPNTMLILGADVWYNGGAWSGKVDPGWAYAEFKALMPIPLREDVTLIPGITYQLSIEDTVNDEDDLYANIALQYKW